MLVLVIRRSAWGLLEIGVVSVVVLLPGLGSAPPPPPSAIVAVFEICVTPPGSGEVTFTAKTTVPLVAASLARRGQERLSTVAFHTDCRPLLAAAVPYGIDVCCVSLVRSLDDAAAREIGRAVCGNPEILLPLVHALKAHEQHDDAVAGLQDALDAWWDGALRGVVAAKLDAIASPRTAVAPAAQKEQPRK